MIIPNSEKPMRINTTTGTISYYLNNNNMRIIQEYGES
jgi:hypothetical protein